jgi:hypothetical protein
VFEPIGSRPLFSAFEEAGVQDNGDSTDASFFSLLLFNTTKSCVMADVMTSSVART